MIENLKYLAVEDEEWSNELTMTEGEIDVLVRLFRQLKKVSVIVGDISWIEMRHKKGKRIHGNIELLDSEEVDWMKKAIARIEKRWREAAEDFEADGGKIHFGLDIKGILRGGQPWKGKLDIFE